MSRTSFANYTCKQLYEKYNGDFNNNDFIAEARVLRKHFDENVRNIYECVVDIPLFQYIDYLDMYFNPMDIVCEEFENIEDKTEILQRIQLKAFKSYNTPYEKNKLNYDYLIETINEFKYTRPDFTAKYVALDISGQWHIFQEKPEFAKSGYWSTRNKGSYYLHGGNFVDHEIAEANLISISNRTSLQSICKCV